ncbi:hypothetical protein GCM10009601_41830 [Streptomyces thermospinosisporus]|uniref:Tetratricopeptide repeat protein n=1 Tax=Streptomyces thermospinosisporus TaxID=161482 RepID=A0ABN1Z271_9ACTN
MADAQLSMQQLVQRRRSAALVARSAERESCRSAEALADLDRALQLKPHYEWARIQREAISGPGAEPPAEPPPPPSA